MGTSRWLILMRVVLFTSLAITVSMSAAVIAAPVIKKGHTYIDLMGLENAIIVLFGLLSFNLTIYFVFALLWPVRNSTDEESCSQVLLEDIHDYGVGNRDKPLFEATRSNENFLGGLEDSSGMNSEIMKFDTTYSSGMNFGQPREFFTAHAAFSGILDEFWGNLFDLQGNLTENGKIIRLDLLVGLCTEENTKSFPSFFYESGLCDHLKLVNYSSTKRMLPLFRINNNSMCPQQGHCTLPAIIEIRKTIMRSFLKENPSLLRDEKSYVVMENDQVQHGVLTYENFYNVTQSIGMSSNCTPYQDSYPLEELKTMAVLVQKCPSQQLAQQPSQTNICFSYNELKGLLLNSFRGCIQSISNLEKADWLIQGRGGYDEKLIGLAAEMVIFGDVTPKGEFSPNAIVDSSGKMFNMCTSVLGCGDSCMFQPYLIISFGVWCISRICELLPLVEQPVLLGKYSRVLNRLQGILDTAFLKPAQPVFICPCTDTVPEFNLPDESQRISVETVLKMLMELEAAIYDKQREKVHGTGKKNLKSVLKRYKRRLSKMPVMARQN